MVFEHMRESGIILPHGVCRGIVSVGSPERTIFHFPQVRWCHGKWEKVSYIQIPFIVEMKRLPCVMCMIYVYSRC